MSICEVIAVFYSLNFLLLKLFLLHFSWFVFRTLDYLTLDVVVWSSFLRLELLFRNLYWYSFLLFYSSFSFGFPEYTIVIHLYRNVYKCIYKPIIRIIYNVLKVSVLSTSLRVFRINCFVIVVWNIQNSLSICRFRSFEFSGIYIILFSRSGPL